MSYSDPKQETGGSMNSENRQLAETVVTPLPDSSGLLVQDKAPTNFTVTCDKSFSDGSQASLGDSLSIPAVLGAIQELQPAPESYKDAIHKQDPVKRQRDWDEDTERAKKRVDNLEKRVTNLRQENDNLKKTLDEKNRSISEKDHTIRERDHTIRVLRIDNESLSQELQQVYNVTGAKACVNASDSLSVAPSYWDKHQT